MEAAGDNMSGNYPAWLNDAVVYEIYPQSFCDSNGDGIGDIQGIISKLDYIKSLHCNAIWLNPCFASPFFDAGYDISDFYQVAPRYGTNDDLKELFEIAHRKGIKVILDLVAGHTSIEHPWFIDAANNPDSKYKNYFVWTDGWNQDTGNFRFIGGHNSKRDGLYMINFFYCQPALNYGFHEPELPWQMSSSHPDCIAVREELKNIMKFWLDMGCDGFRVDMAQSLIKGKNAQKGIRELWHYYRSYLAENYPDAVLVSEWSEPQVAIDAGFHVDFMVHFGKPGYNDMFRQEPKRVGNSPFAVPGKASFCDQSGKGNAEVFFNEIVDNMKHIGGKGFFSVPTGNHDIGRIRNGRTLEELKAVYALLFTLPGVPFLYYGDEIGMDNVFGLGNHEGSYNRSTCRTPMQWDSSNTAGFSTAAPEQFYLPLDPSPKRPTVAEQEKQTDSLLNFTRKLLELRKTIPALGNCGEFELLYLKPYTAPVVYLRRHNQQVCLIAVNPFGTPQEAVLGVENASGYKLLAGSSGAVMNVAAGAATIKLPAAGFAIWQRQ